MSDWSDFDLSQIPRELVPVIWWTAVAILFGVAAAEIIQRIL